MLMKVLFVIKLQPLLFSIITVKKHTFLQTFTATATEVPNFQNILKVKYFYI